MLIKIHVRRARQKPVTALLTASVASARKSPASPMQSTSARPTLKARTSLVRMQMRRFTRLTNGFSTRIEHQVAAIALHFVYYNFVRIH